MGRKTASNDGGSPLRNLAAAIVHLALNEATGAHYSSPGLANLDPDPESAAAWLYSDQAIAFIQELDIELDCWFEHLAAVLPPLETTEEL